MTYLSCSSAYPLRFDPQVRAWVVTIPLPKVPPIVLGALAISDSVSAATLNEYTNRVLDGLHSRGIWPVSYACDGTEKERVNERLMEENAHGIDSRRIRSPSPMMPDLLLNIPLYHGKPIALMQDSAHALKTGRNNLQSGAKAMVLGNHVAQYKHLRDMAYDSDSPIYIRDVEKTDKQDDRAAIRVASSSSIEWLNDHGEEYNGTKTYLFVIGEGIDAYQSRRLGILERINMLMRMYYFIQLWKIFLDNAGYSVKLACISREFLDICDRLVTGFLSLVFIYRDYMQGSPFPLVPWLHSSETVEHVFAECRKHIKDFNFADFVTMMPKVHWLIRYVMNFETSTQDAKARASGYSHRWFDTEDLTLSGLASFPSDVEIEQTARNAYQEAEQLWESLGVVVDFLTWADRMKAVSTVLQDSSHHNEAVGSSKLPTS